MSFPLQTFHRLLTLLIIYITLNYFTHLCLTLLTLTDKLLIPPEIALFGGVTWTVVIAKRTGISERGEPPVFVIHAREKSVAAVGNHRRENQFVRTANTENSWTVCAAEFLSRGFFPTTNFQSCVSEKNSLGKPSGSCTKLLKWPFEVLSSSQDPFAATSALPKKRFPPTKPPRSLVNVPPWSPLGRGGTFSFYRSAHGLV